jgi:hypothetical protein
MLGWGILGVIVWILVAIWPGRVASNKGHSFFAWFIISLFFWWITLFWVYFGMKDKTKTAQDVAYEEVVDKKLDQE